MGNKPYTPAGAVFQEIFARFPLALALLDDTGRLRFVNNRFATLCGSSQEAAYNRKIWTVLPVPGLQSLFDASLKDPHPRKGEFLFPTPEGEPSVIQATLTPFRCPASSTIPLSLLLLEDISEKVRWEEQLLQAEKFAGMAELAATVAHELGNPLGIIFSTLQYLQTHLCDNLFHEEITVIIDQVERMHELLRTLMDVTGPVEQRSSHERVERLIAQVLTFIAKEADKHQVRIKTDFAAELPLCWADARQLKQVFLNLCKNALEAMPTGGTLTVSVSPTAGLHEVEIQIKDTGVGIPAEELDRIWKPFHSTKAGGRGLGLSLCRRVVEQQEGKINVRSTLGRGTTFHIILPANRE